MSWRFSRVHPRTAPMTNNRDQRSPQTPREARRLRVLRPPACWAPTSPENPGGRRRPREGGIPPQAKPSSPPQSRAERPARTVCSAAGVRNRPKIGVFLSLV
eukprot:5465744-Pyramimonas_sp.AAC.1